MGFKLQRITQINTHRSLAQWTCSIWSRGTGRTTSLGLGRRKTSSLVFCKLMTIWFCAAHRLMLSNSSTRSVSDARAQSRSGAKKSRGCPKPTRRQILGQHEFWTQWLRLAVSLNQFFLSGLGSLFYCTTKRSRSVVGLKFRLENSYKSFKIMHIVFWSQFNSWTTLCF